MRNGTYTWILASIVAQAVAACSSDDGGTMNTAGGGGQGGDSVNSAGASGTTTDDTEGGAAGAAGEGGGSAGDAGSGGMAGGTSVAGSDHGGATDTGYDRTECPPCERGCAAGDPHIITFDGAYYDFQAPGEYVLVASGDLVVQARLLPTDACADVAYVRAVAFGSATHKISVHADAERFVRLGDGTSLPFGELKTEFGDWQLASACDGVIATSAAGDQVIVHFVGGSWLDVEVRPAATASALGGFFGNLDGDETNDIALPDGTPLPNPVPWEGLYSAFGGSWGVTDETSLFVYDSDESAADYAGGGMPGVVDLSTVSDDALAAAASACGEVTNPDLFQGCLTDAVCSGADAEVAAAWFVTNPEPKVVLTVEEPTTIELCYIGGGVVMNLENNTVDCPANCPQMGTIWGTDIYTDDSAVCTAAVHAGLIDNDVGGTVSVNPEPGQDSYLGSTQNGVTSESYGAWGGSFSLSL